MSQFDAASGSPRLASTPSTTQQQQRHIERRRSTLGRDEWLQQVAPKKLDSSQILLDLYGAK